MKKINEKQKANRAAPPFRSSSAATYGKKNRLKTPNFAVFYPQNPLPSSRSLCAAPQSPAANGTAPGEARGRWAMLCDAAKPRGPDWRRRGERGSGPFPFPFPSFPVFFPFFPVFFPRFSAPHRRPSVPPIGAPRSSAAGSGVSGARLTPPLPIGQGKRRGWDQCSARCLSLVTDRERGWD